MKRLLTLLFCAVATLALGQTGPLTWEQQLDIIRRGKDHALQIQDLRVKDAATIGGNVTIAGTLGVTGVLTPSGGMSAASLTAGTSATAINGNAITNLNAANIREGTTIPAINGAAITNLGAANLVAGGTLPALNGAAVTALKASNVVWTTIGTVNVTNGQAVTLVPGCVNSLLGTGQASGLTNTITLSPYPSDLSGVANRIAYIVTPGTSSNVVLITGSDPVYSPAVELSAGEMATIYFANTNVFYLHE